MSERLKLEPAQTPATKGGPGREEEAIYPPFFVLNRIKLEIRNL